MIAMAHFVEYALGPKIYLALEPWRWGPDSSVLLGPVSDYLGVDCAAHTVVKLNI